MQPMGQQQPQQQQPQLMPPQQQQPPGAPMGMPPQQPPQQQNMVPQFNQGPPQNKFFSPPMGESALSCVSTWKSLHHFVYINEQCRLLLPEPCVTQQDGMWFEDLFLHFVYINEQCRLLLPEPCVTQQDGMWFEDLFLHFALLCLAVSVLVRVFL